MELFDCSIRDGGYVNKWNFSTQQVRECYETAFRSGMKYCEVGFRRSVKTLGPWYYTPEDLLNETFVDIHDECKIAVMAQMGTFSIDDFVPKIQSKISMVRILIAYHCGDTQDDSVLDTKLLNDTITMANDLNLLGYETTINIGRIDKISFENLQTICEMINGTPIKYLYIADTYGSIGLVHLRTILSKMKTWYSGKIGFHGHDNLSNASTKSIDALYNGSSIVDVTFGGHGRGAGNTKAELIISHLIKWNLKTIDNLRWAIKYTSTWVTPDTEFVAFLISGHFGMHVNYAIELSERGYSAIEIFDLMLKLQNYSFFNIKEIDRVIGNATVSSVL